MIAFNVDKLEKDMTGCPDKSLFTADIVSILENLRKRLDAISARLPLEEAN